MFNIKSFLEQNRREFMPKQSRFVEQAPVVIQFVDINGTLIDISPDVFLFINNG